MLSIPHMIVVFIVVLVVFGPQKLPELAKGLGKLMAEFRKASTDFKSAFEEEMRDLERQALMAERKKAAEAAAASAAAQAAPPATPEMASGAETPSNGSQAETRETETREIEAPVVVPVQEAIPRSTEELAETNPETKPETAGLANSQDLPHDPQHPA